MMILLEIIKELESLLWFIVIVVALYIVLKYYSMPQSKLKHDRQMKADAYEREKAWYFIKRTEKPIDAEKQLLEFKKELDECKKEFEELQKKDSELTEETESLKKEKEQFELEILKTKIKTYEEIIKTINK